MHASDLEATRAEVLELVRNAGVNHCDVARPRFILLVTCRHECPACMYDPLLDVRVDMQLDPFSWLVIDIKERDG